MIVFKVAFKKKGGEQQQKQKFEEVISIYKQVPGLKRKYFMVDPKAGESVGIYVFENQEAMEAYLKSDVWRNVVLANAVGKPKIETYTVTATTDDGVLV